MGFNINFHTCNLSTDVRRLRDFFAGRPLNAFDDPGLSDAERTAVARLIRSSDANGPDEFGLFQITFTDDGELELFAPGLLEGAKCLGGTVLIRHPSVAVVDFLFNLASVGNLVLTPDTADACPLVTSDQLKHEIAHRFPDIKVVPSPSALESELRYASDSWHRQSSDERDNSPATAGVVGAVGTWTRMQHWFEIIASALFAGLMGSGAMIWAGFLLVFSMDGSAWEMALAGLFFLFCLATEGWLLVTLWCALRIPWIEVTSKTPLVAVQVAMKQPRLPYLVRPVVALWWMLHFCYGLILGMILPVVDKQMPLAAVLFLALIATTFSYLTFFYLLLVVTVFTKSPARLRSIWRWRGRWAMVHGMLVVGTHFVVAFF